MAEENNGSVVADETDAIAVKKQRAPRRSKAAAELSKAPSKAEPAKAPIVKRKTYGEREKAEKLKLIATQIAQGTTPLQQVVKNAGISVQTYYQWKRSEKPVTKKAEKAVSGGSELAELVQLEAENNRLRALLAEKLRAENVELRKRLGLV